MKPSVIALVTHLFLHEVVFTRNRNFHAFEDDRFREALSVTRRFRSLLSDLERLHAREGSLKILVGQVGGKPAIRLELVRAGERRTSHLRRDEWQVFTQHPRAASLLRALGQDVELAVVL